MKGLIIALAGVLLAGCVTIQPPQWSPVDPSFEADYEHYLAGGNGVLTGQAFLTQLGGGVVKAAGRTVTLDPATTIGTEWWTKAGTNWVHRSLTPPSPGFARARRTTVADAEGRFKFTGLAPGRYYVRTEVTWMVPGSYVPEGGIVGRMVEVRDGEPTEVILNEFASSGR